MPAKCMNPGHPHQMGHPRWNLRGGSDRDTQKEAARTFRNRGYELNSAHSAPAPRACAHTCKPRPTPSTSHGCTHPSANLRTGGGSEALREGPRPTGGSGGCDPVGADRPCTDRDRGRERGPACTQSALPSLSCCGGSLQTPVGVSRRSKQRLKRRCGTFLVPLARARARLGANVYF